MPAKPLVLLLLGLYALASPAQLESPFADRRDWQVLSSERVDVYFHGNRDAEADLTARLAEVAFHEVAVLYDYRKESRIALLYESSPGDLLGQRMDANPDFRRPGRFNLPARYASVAHPGSTRGLYAEVKRAVARQLLYEFLYGGDLSAVMQSELLLYKARWFQEGLVDYVAEGWTFEDEMWVNTLHHEDLLQLAIEGEGKVARVARKSVWHFIVHEYGEQKIPEIIYLTSISHSIESGIISVLGITVSTLSQRWRDFILLRNESLSRGRMMAANLEQKEEIPVRNGSRLLSFAFCEKTHRIAYWLEREGVQSLHVYDLATHETRPLPLSMGQPRADAQFASPSLPLAWSPDGTQLVTVWEEQGARALAWLELENPEPVLTELPAGFHAVQSLSWAPLGDRIALSALHEGVWDLYVLPLRSENYQALTQDSFDDLDAAWLPDGETLVFSSNRQGPQDAARAPWQRYREDFDLYRISATGSSLGALTATPGVDERNPQPGVGDALVYRSDATGLFNLYRIPQGGGEVRALSDFAPGICAFAAGGPELLIAEPVGGKLYLHLLPLSALQAPSKPVLSLLRLERNAALQARPPVNESPRPAAPAPRRDTAAVQSAAPRYYIFDEEDQTPEKQERERRQPAVSSGSGFSFYQPAPPPNPDTIAVEQPYRASSPWTARYLGLGFSYDPVGRLGPTFEMRFEDLFRRHQLDIDVRPSFNLRSSVSEVRYTYARFRTRLFASGGHLSRRIRVENVVQPDSSFLYRFDQLRLNAGLRYPLSSYASIEAGGGALYIDRKDQRLRRQDLNNDQDWLLRAGLAYRFRKVREVEGFRQKGVQAGFQWDSYYSLGSGTWAFHRTQAEVRAYRPVGKQFTLAARLAAGLTLPRTLAQYYLGGADVPLHRPILFQGSSSENMRRDVLDNTLYSVHFLEPLMPLRGFMPNTRDGSRYVVSNLELRIPLSRVSRRGLPSHGLYNMELLPFVDAGTVWVEGNPFSQKKPTDTQFINSGPISVKLQTLKSPFLIGFGSGLRVNILTWSARVDLAWGIDDYTVQRPTLTTSLARNF